MKQLANRQVFSSEKLARLVYDEPVITRDPATGIDLHYRFEHAAGGKLLMSGGLLHERLLIVGCEPDDINTISTLILDGVRLQLG